MKVWLVRQYFEDEGYSGWCKVFREKFDAYMFIANTIKNEYSKITD